MGSQEGEASLSHEQPGSEHELGSAHEPARPSTYWEMRESYTDTGEMDPLLPFAEMGASDGNNFSLLQAQIAEYASGPDQSKLESLLEEIIASQGKLGSIGLIADNLKELHIPRQYHKRLIEALASQAPEAMIRNFDAFDVSGVSLASIVENIKSSSFEPELSRKRLLLWAPVFHEKFPGSEELLRGTVIEIIGTLRDADTVLSLISRLDTFEEDTGILNEECFRALSRKVETLNKDNLLAGKMTFRQGGLEAEDYTLRYLRNVLHQYSGYFGLDPQSADQIIADSIFWAERYYDAYYRPDAETANTATEEKGLSGESFASAEKERTTKEIAEAFEAVGIPLTEKLAALLNSSEMLADNVPLLGSIYTQASSMLRGSVNREAALFQDTVKLDASSLRDKLDQVLDKMHYTETQLFVKFIRSICLPETPASRSTSPKVSHITPEMHCGSCTDAEGYFLEWIQFKKGGGSKTFEQNGLGAMNIIVDRNREPLFIEKINLGQPSALTLRPVLFKGIEIPAGSLVALQHDSFEPGVSGRSMPKNVFSLESVTGAKFLRFSTLAVDPQFRERAFRDHLILQVRRGFASPEKATLAELLEIARGEVSERMLAANAPVAEDWQANRAA